MKASQNLSVLGRLERLLTFTKKQILFKVIFESQFLSVALCLDAL